jgi:predicted nucleotidyltransferase
LAFDAMSTHSRLGRQIAEIIDAFRRLNVPFALIGGLALAPHKVIRATQDVDLLTDAHSAEAINDELIRLGYRCLHRSADAGNYLRDDQRLDLLYASRPKALDLLSTAGEYPTPFGTLRAVSAEGLIAFKLQALVNNPRRTQDLEDIRALIRNNRTALDIDVVREYFKLFDRETLLAEILLDIDR